MDKWELVTDKKIIKFVRKRILSKWYKQINLDIIYILLCSINIGVCFFSRYFADSSFLTLWFLWFIIIFTAAAACWAIWNMISVIKFVQKEILKNNIYKIDGTLIEASWCPNGNFAKISTDEGIINLLLPKKEKPNKGTKMVVFCCNLSYWNDNQNYYYKSAFTYEKYNDLI